MAAEHGEWSVVTEDEPSVRLVSKRIGLMRIDVTAPVVGGLLRVSLDASSFHLELSLNRMKATNPLMEGAAKALVSKYDGDRLVFDAAGAGGSHPWPFEGIAHSGHVDVPLTVKVSPAGPHHDPMGEAELEGAAVLPEVNIPIPGLGSMKDFTFSVGGRVRLSPAG